VSVATYFVIVDPLEVKLLARVARDADKGRLDGVK